MKITDVHVDGFGVWSDLRLEELSNRLTVFYGPNESGKTTLLQFVRAVLYGFSSERRRGYLRPLRGGQPGGSMHVFADEEEFLVTRHGDADSLAAGEVTVTAPDGTIQGEHQLKGLLAEIDETTFNNVFAVGLGEMQELGTLSDSEAADWLYDLTGGLDRVSLPDVTRALEASRNRLLAVDDRPCQVLHLLGERQRLQAEIEQQLENTRRWARLHGDRRRVDSHIAQAEEEKTNLEQSARVVEAALAVYDRWQKRVELDLAMQTLDPQIHLADDAIERLDKLCERLSRGRERQQELHERRGQLRKEAAALNIDKSLWRHGPRVAALAEQQPWIAAVHAEVQDLDREVADLNQQMTVASERLGLGPHLPTANLPEVSSRAIATLRPAAKAVRSAKSAMDAAEQQVAQSNQAAATMDAEIQAALASRNESELAGALETAGDRVAHLRQRIQLDERLDQLARQQAELDQRGVQLLERQLMPVWIVASLGGAFVVGVVLILAQFIFGSSALGVFGGALAVLGLCGSGVSLLAKFLLERSARQSLDASQKQLSLVGRQIEQAKHDRDQLDRQMPRGGGPPASRLQAAEKELDALEDLLPLDARRQAARGEAAAAEGRATVAREQLGAARRQWRKSLAAAGLPAHLSPRQIRELSAGSDQVAELQRRLAERTQTQDHRRRELDSVATRVSQLVADVGRAPSGVPVLEQVQQLAAALAEQEGRVQRYETLRRRNRQLKRKQARTAQRMEELRNQRRALLREAGVGSDEEYRRLVEQLTVAQRLLQERETLSDEINGLLGVQIREDEVAPWLAEETPDGLLAHWQQFTEQIESIHERLNQQREQLGELGEQIRTLSADRQLAEKRFELEELNVRLDHAIEAWQVRAVICQMLDTIRRDYEQHRQPETLREASGYLARLTEGHYVRVWTPLGEDALYVDDGDGNSRAVNVLSRGTREQLFLSLRLALVALYARRGATLPLVLDDVLVNFDAERAKAAAALLRDFAKEGHQLLVFTCHEHVWKMFKSLRADVRRLPSNAEQNEATSDPPREAEPPKRRAPEAIPEPVVATVDVEEQDYEEEDEEYEEEDIEAEGDEEELDEYEEVDEEEDEFDEDEEDELEDEEEGEFEEEDEEEYELEDEEYEDEEFDEDEEELDEDDLAAEAEDDDEQRPEGARGWEVEFEDEDESEAA